MPSTTAWIALVVSGASTLAQAQLQTQFLPMQWLLTEFQLFKVNG